jgi:uncharacterized protein with von Willebrand factor type A (vWA) domain
MEQFLTSLLGALVGGVIALIGVYVAHRLQLSRERTQNEQILRGFLQAILTELETSWSRAEQTVNPVIEQLSPNAAFDRYVFIDTDFFTVYHNNSHLLGRVNDDSLRELIVATYTQYKALTETYNVNTRFLQRWKESEHTVSITADESLKRYYQQKAQREHAELVAWAHALKHDHLELKQQIDKLILALRNAIDVTAAT